jgi:hypothetical protein
VRVVYRRLEDPDDPIIREVLTRMSRFVCGLQTPGDIRDEVMYIGETVFPVKLARCRPGAVTKEKYLYLTADPGKAGRPMYFAPGCMLFLAFLDAAADKAKAGELVKKLCGYIAENIPGAAVEGNDVLVGSGKCCGVEAIFDPDRRGVHIQTIVTLEAAAAQAMTTEADFAGRKYGRIAGACDGGRMERGQARLMVLRLADLIAKWRAANG